MEVPPHLKSYLVELSHEAMGIWPHKYDTSFRAVTPVGVKGEFSDVIRL